MYMYKQKSYVYVKQDWLAAGGGGGVVGGVSGHSVAQFHVHIIFQLLKVPIKPNFGL